MDRRETLILANKKNLDEAVQFELHSRTRIWETTIKNKEPDAPRNTMPCEPYLDGLQQL